MSYVVFIFCFILIGILTVFLVKQGMKCEGFAQVKLESNLPKYPTTNRNPDPRHSVPEVWNGYNRFSMYSTQVNPGNPTGYRYMDTKYDRVMRQCAPACYGAEDIRPCLTACIKDALANSLTPIYDVTEQ